MKIFKFIQVLYEAQMAVWEGGRENYDLMEGAGPTTTELQCLGGQMLNRQTRL